MAQVKQIKDNKRDWRQSLQILLNVDSQVKSTLDLKVYLDEKIFSVTVIHNVTPL